MAAMASEKPLPVDYRQRSVGVSFPADAPSSYRAGDTVSFELSSLAMSGRPNNVTGNGDDKKDGEVTISIGDQVLGTFTVDNTIGTTANDEYGTASVRVTLPAGLPAGATTLTVTGATTGTSVNLPAILVEGGEPEPEPTSDVEVTLSAKDSVLEQGKGNGVKLTAELRLDGQKVRGGSVAFYDGESLLATVAPTGGSGKADFVLSKNTALGKHTITAVHTDAEGVESKPSNAVTITVVAGTTVRR
jgi:5'-nucleotidase